MNCLRTGQAHAYCITCMDCHIHVAISISRWLKRVEVMLHEGPNCQRNVYLHWINRISLNHIELYNWIRYLGWYEPPSVRHPTIRFDLTLCPLTCCESVLELPTFIGNGLELREKVGKELRLTPSRLRLGWGKGWQRQSDFQDDFFFGAKKEQVIIFCVCDLTLLQVGHRTR